MAEIVRAGILSVDEGQTEAAQALGMTRAADDAADRAAAGDARDHPADRQRDDLDAEDHLARRASSPITELLYSAQLIYAANYKPIPLLIVVEHLVPRRHDDPVDRPVLPRAALRPRLRVASCRRRRCSACAAGCAFRHARIADARRDREIGR